MKTKKNKSDKIKVQKQIPELKLVEITQEEREKIRIKSYTYAI